MNNPEPVILAGDSLERLKELPDNSVDAVVTDPPYGLSNTKPAQVADVLAAWVTGDTEAVPAKRGGFMGKDWDSFVPPPAVWEECLRVLKPGGHMAVFAGARTQDLMGLSIRLAGFDIRDGLSWITGTGFPKGQDIGKQIGKRMGAEHEATAPATDEARKWDGWNTQLKPAQEPIILARKPLNGTVANNVLAHGVGGLNIDASRVGSDGGTVSVNFGETRGAMYDRGKGKPTNEIRKIGKGRFPANVLLDEHAAAEMDKQSWWSKSPGTVTRGGKRQEAYGMGRQENMPAPGDSGGASRFFPVFKYQAKAPKRERPVIEREDGTKIQHVAVKPLALMEWLVTLITPPGGTVLDPFAGSGTTLQAARNNGFQSTGIEQEEEYVALIHERLNTKHRTPKEADR